MNCNNGLKILCGYLFNPLIILLLFLNGCDNVSTTRFPPSKEICKDNLKMLGKALKAYRLKYDSYPPIDGGENHSNWASYLKSKGDWGMKLSINCPYGNKHYSKYFFANINNEKCFPKKKFTENIPPETPIAGDPYDPESKFGSHGSIRKNNVHILLFNGNVIEVDPRQEEIGKRAYEQGCLRGKFDASKFKKD